MPNQYTPDPREQVCWDFYIETVQKGLPNAYESAIKAQYAEDTARNITLNGWFKDRISKLKRKDMLSKAERNLDKVLDMVTLDDKGKEDANLLRIQVDVSKTVVTTLGKDEGYSTRNELTGKEGQTLQIVIPASVAETFNLNESNTETRDNDKR